VPRFTDEDDALLDALGVEVETATPGSRTAREERIIAGFEDVQRWVDEHGRAPQARPGGDIFERLYAVRLERIRSLAECRALVEPLDRQGLLQAGGDAPTVAAEALDDDELLAALGVEAESAGVTELKHVRSSAEKRAADEVASTRRCEDFEKFRPLFKTVDQELKSGLRQSQVITATNRSIEARDFFVVGGLVAYVAEVGPPIKSTAGEVDSRLRVIYSNGTESNLLLRSLQRAFYEDPAARRLAVPESGQLALGDTWEADDVESGTIYVLRSRSEHPYIAANREFVHKIGVTGGKVETRIANAENDATYLLAGVDVVATYKLAGINRVKLENLFHRIFAAARLNITIPDRFGKPVVPREWYLVPISAIDAAVERLHDGTITEFTYDPEKAALAKVKR
jgi:hypothetical protein